MGRMDGRVAFIAGVARGRGQSPAIAPTGVATLMIDAAMNIA